jgi:chemotaxis protein MotB
MGRRATLDEKPAVQHLFQRLERMEAEMEHNGHAGHNRWMIPYADLLTLLLGLFLVIFTSGQAGNHILKPASDKAMAAKTSTVRQDNRQLSARLQRQLQNKLHRKDVEVRYQYRGVVVSLQDRVLFKPGSAELSPQAKQTLSRVVQELRSTMGPEPRPIRVEGHTDNTPIHTSQFPSNWELSTARATSIVRYLVTSRQFPPDKLSAVGYAEFKPLHDNSTIEGKQKNRRVDIVVLRSQIAANMPGDEPPNAAPSGMANALETRDGGVRK